VFVSIRRYRVGQGSVDELLRQVESEFVPVIKKAPGYLGHYAIASDDGTIISITGVQERSGIGGANRLASDWARDNLKRFDISGLEVSEGEVRIIDRA
jgi:hypothetical protein